MKLKEFISFLTENHNLKYHIYNSLDDSLPLSVRLVLTLDNVLYESWGVSTDHDLAFFKALMELTERVCMRHSCPYIFESGIFSRKVSITNLCIKNNIPLSLVLPSNSNGMAVGITRSMAKKSAKRELIERHAILLSLLLNIKPKRIIGLIKKNPQLEGHDLQFYHLKVNNHHVILLLDILPNNGVLTTHACSESIELAKEKAFEEMIPNIIYYNNNLEHKIEIKAIEKDNILSFIRYWKFSGDTRLIDFLKDQNGYPKDIPPIHKFYFGECKVPQIFKRIGFPLFCYRAISPTAQQLFLDNWKKEYINPRFSDSTLPDFPHCIS